ncbi:hypothetical protein AOC36_10410 [Erysipelothrix larvae]|uniref:VOC domain-containing protein n=1 Tax=Erysipelothrix larvae TaxID=1514105 RepID=A0A120JTY9_9FIRM|nr:VOC family protein [Erysipelothrix larvae]AMC94368.1 hypothetical protein AOC36_10410 [Erysipelothrix larvae]
MVKTYGIHHVSSVVGHAQKDIDFNAGVLGTRLVKKTLNFDHKENYHLYYGNHDGSSGLITTFPQVDTTQGRVGTGQVGFVTYGVRPDSFTFWKHRFKHFHIPHYEYTRFGSRRLAFEDPTGLELELIETKSGPDNRWSFNGVAPPNNLIGIHSATLFSRFPLLTESLLVDCLGYEKIDEDDEISRYKIHDDLGGLLEIKKKLGNAGTSGVGVVHHIAFKILEEDLEDWVKILQEKGYRPTEIKDRKYFKSIYFREKGGILIELATMGPGVLVDESLETLGTTFKIPPQFEHSFDLASVSLMPLEVKSIDALGNYGYRNRHEYELLQTKQTLRSKIQTLLSIQRKRTLTPDEQRQLNHYKQTVINLSKGDQS